MTDPELVKICINFSYFTTIIVFAGEYKKVCTVRGQINFCSAKPMILIKRKMRCEKETFWKPLLQQYDLSITFTFIQ